MSTPHSSNTGAAPPSRGISIKISARLALLLLLLFTTACGDAEEDEESADGGGPAATFYVAPDGDDDSSGDESEPWRTIQHAVDSGEPGDTILVRGGVYTEQVTIDVSGDEISGPVILRSHPSETAILDGTDLIVPDEDSALVLIDGQNHLVVAGFELRNYRTGDPDRTPMGIYVAGDAHHIQLLNNRVHQIENNGGADGNAHGIGVYGTEAPAAIHDLVIRGNELHDLVLGNSEALVLNGNVRDFEIVDNVVRDSDNIGIDLIGFEGTAPDAAVDRARDGVVGGNLVYNIDTVANPAYGGERSAAGIYVDGGTRIVVERNVVHSSNFGIEIASEHTGRSTTEIIVRSNLLYHNHVAGLAMGGYDSDRGRTESCLVLNNTFFENDTDATGSGELLIQFDTADNVIQNNIFVSGAQGLFFSNDYDENSGNVVDDNLYFGPAGSQNSVWGWRNAYYDAFDAYRAATGNDQRSLFADPLFVDAAAPDLRLAAGSPAMDRGMNRPESGALDLNGNPRLLGDQIDLGAYEKEP